MTKEKLEDLIGTEAIKDVTEMGGVMSRVIASAMPLVANGKLTPDEGQEVYHWAVGKEAEIKELTEPESWKGIIRDSMSGQSLEKRGISWFKKSVNEIATDLVGNPIYDTSK